MGAATQRTAKSNRAGQYNITTQVLDRILLVVKWRVAASPTGCGSVERKSLPVDRHNLFPNKTFGREIGTELSLPVGTCIFNDRNGVPMQAKTKRALSMTATTSLQPSFVIHHLQKPDAVRLAGSAAWPPREYNLTELLRLKQQLHGAHKPHSAQPSSNAPAPPLRCPNPRATASPRISPLFCHSASPNGRAGFSARQRHFDQERPPRKAFAV